MDHIDDQTIIDRVLKGDRNAFGVLAAKYQGPIYNLMVRTAVSAEDASELAQDVFLKAFARLETYVKGQSSFFSWLYAIGLNTARDDLRRRERQGRLVAAGAAPRPWEAHAAGAAANAQTEEQWTEIHSLQQAMSTLPLNQRETLILKYRYQMTMQEIADAFGVSTSAVKMRIQRGLAELRRQLKDEQ